MARQFQMRRWIRMSRYAADDAELAQRRRLVVVDAQRREQHRVLEGEVVLGVEVDALEPGVERLGGARAGARTSGCRRRSRAR